MDVKQTYSKHYNRFKRESLIKSFLYGAFIGFLVAAVMSLTFWYFDVKAFWLSIPVFVVVTAAAGYLLSVTKFKPQAKYMAKRLDAFGLDERLITMTQYENDDSFIAKLQREDALSSAKRVDDKLIKFAVSVPLIVGMAVALLFSGGMTTVNALSSAGVIRSGKQIVADANAVPDTYYNLDYVIDGSGVIMGAETQVLRKGESGTPVLAVADYGYAFVRWSDGYTEPYRQDFNVQSDTLLTAIFETVANVNDRELVKDFSSTGSSLLSSSDDDDSDNGIPSRPDPSEFPDTPDDKEKPEYSSSSYPNSVHDGETDYGGKIYGDALSDATDDANSGSDLSDGSKDVIGGYFDVIKN